jgi:hypothetical protein
MDDIFASLKSYEFDLELLKSKSIMRFYEKTRSEETKQNIRESKLGIKQTPEHIQNRVNSVTGFKQSDFQKQRVIETFATEWLITDPKGKSYEIYNLREFCRQNNLDQPNMSSRGKHKGWKCVKIVS